MFCSITPQGPELRLRQYRRQLVSAPGLIQSESQKDENLDRVRLGDHWSVCVPPFTPLQLTAIA
jgi:hypothetical protein